MQRPHHPLRRPPANSRAVPYRDELATPPPGPEPRKHSSGRHRWTMAAEVTVSREELELCAAQPLRLLVLMYWRCRAEGGLPRTAHDIWASLLSVEARSADGAGPVRLEAVQEALAFLEGSGVLSVSAAGTGDSR